MGGGECPRSTFDPELAGESSVERHVRGCAVGESGEKVGTAEQRETTDAIA